MMLKPLSDMFSEDFMIREKRNSKILHLSPKHHVLASIVLENTPSEIDY
jgi:hypothetical protein